MDGEVAICFCFRLKDIFLNSNSVWKGVQNIYMQLGTIGHVTLSYP